MHPHIDAIGGPGRRVHDRVEGECDRIVTADLRWFIALFSIQINRRAGILIHCGLKPI